MQQWSSENMSNRIVITGASSLIGQAIAKRLITKGDNVLLHCFKNSSACSHLAEADNHTSEIVTADFSKDEDILRFCKILGDVDILVNAAAYTKTDLLPNLNDIDIERMINVNIKALTAACRAVLPAMMVKRRGIIVNISSVAALRGNRGQSVYAGTKGFVEAFTRSLAAEYGGRGIRINSIAPGAIDAGNLKELLSYAEDAVKKSIASNRLGTPEDVAAAVAFLCSPDASFINGACIAVNGGFMTGI
jgi:3-oxoacyl-[acyl-carrier protein] reductase